ncbi:hypothetical protein INR49_015850 [Caranx melampygus]|nr:hypothetical protein INR49_015850 [Caranx melampygus]
MNNMGTQAVFAFLLLLMATVKAEESKVCENCYELDSFVIGLAVAVDVVITLCVMMLIYTCAQNKNPEASVPAPRVPARSGGQVPTSQTYESLNPNTRANDTYSKVNRTG